MENFGVYTSLSFVFIILIFGFLLKVLGSLLCSDCYSSCTLFFSGMCKTISFIFIAWSVVVLLFASKDKISITHINTKNSFRQVNVENLFAIQDEPVPLSESINNMPIVNTVKYVVELSDEDVNCLELFDAR